MNANVVTISILDLDQNRKKIRYCFMVKIANLEELRKVKVSDYGFIIVFEENKPTIHLTNCKIISENDFLQEKNNSLKYNWFSTYSLAQKELGDLISCSKCNPDKS